MIIDPASDRVLTRGHFSNDRSLPLNDHGIVFYQPVKPSEVALPFLWIVLESLQLVSGIVQDPAF